MRSIRYMYEKLKSLMLDDRIFFSFIVFGVAIGSFGLGRASVVLKEIPSQKGQQSVANINTSLTTESLPQTNVGTQNKIETIKIQTEETKEISSDYNKGEIVASKSGTRYHLLSCPGAKQIKEENKIYFANPQAAEAAGYKPAANCPALQ